MAEPIYGAWLWETLFLPVLLTVLHSSVWMVTQRGGFLRRFLLHHLPGSPSSLQEDCIWECAMPVSLLGISKPQYDSYRWAVSERITDETTAVMPRFLLLPCQRETPVRRKCRRGFLVHASPW